MIHGGQPPDHEPNWPNGPFAASVGAAIEPVPAAATSPAAGPPVLVPFGTPRPRFPTGQRIEIPLLPPPLRPRPTAPARTTQRPRNQRRALVAAGLATVVLVGIGAAMVARNSGPGPRDVVKEFFAALTARDTTRLPIDTCDDNPLCQPGALQTGYQPPQDVAIGDDPGDGDDRQITVTYTLVGQRITDAVAVHGLAVGWLGQRSWNLTTLPGAQVSPPETTPAPITMAGGMLSTPKHGTPVSFWAPPGIYTLTRAATPVFDAARTDLTITTGPPITVTLPTAIRPAVAAAAEQLVRDRIDACAQQKDFIPEVGQPGNRVHSCPLYYSSNHLFTTDPTWTIDSYPQLHLEPADDGTIAVTTNVPGTATVRYGWTSRVVEPRGWTEAVERVQVTVTGRLAEASGQFEWRPA